MAAGQGFKDFVTGEVLTAADVDGYLMQGIWVFANATARDAAVTSPQEGNACYLKDTDVIQVYSGSAWATQSASNPISANIVDAKGDLIAGTAADTVARLAVGANDTVLTADSTTATGLKWAAAGGGGGGMTLLSTTTLSGASTSVSITPTGYTALAVSIEGVDLSAGGDGMSISINNAGNTHLSLVRGESATASIATTNNAAFNYNNGTDMDSSSNNAGWINIYNPTSTTNWKPMDIRTGWVNNGSLNCSYFGGGVFKDNTAVSSIMFDQFGGTTFSAGTVKVYGVK